MSLGHGTSIVTNGLVLYYDQGNVMKSWKGAPTTNLAKNGSNQIDWSVSALTQAVTRSTVTANEVYRITSTSLTGTSFRIRFDNATLTNGATYTVSYKYKLISGGPLFRANDWCDTAITRTTTSLQNGVFYETAVGTRATYDSTYRFLDFEMSNNTVIEIWDMQLEERAFATPYSSNQIRSSTQALLDLTNRNTITATSLAYASNGSFSFDGSTSGITTSQTGTQLGIGTNLTISIFTRRAASPTNVLQGQAGFGSGGSISIKNTTTYYFADVISANSTRYLVLMTADGSMAPYENIWINLCVTVNGPIVTTYVNGVLATTQTMDNTMKTIATETFSTGVGYGYFRLQGDLPSVNVYNRALSSQEVLQNFNAIRGRYGL